MAFERGGGKDEAHTSLAMPTTDVWYCGTPVHQISHMNVRKTPEVAISPLAEEVIIFSETAEWRARGKEGKDAAHTSLAVPTTDVCVLWSTCSSNIAHDLA